jgi:hypothetical protein
MASTPCTSRGRRLRLAAAGPGSGDHASVPVPGVLTERGRDRQAAIAMATAAMGLGPMGSNEPELGPRRSARTPADASGAFIYRKGRYTPLGAIPGAAALGAIPGFPDATFFETHFAINDRGETAGFYGDAVPGSDGLPPGSTHGFVKDRRGKVASFDLSGARDLFVKGNNDHGQVVGEYIDAAPGPDGMLPPGSVHGFIRQRSGRINSFDVPFFRLHDIADINDRGQISGGYYDAEGTQHGFLFERGSYKTLDAPGRTDNIAWGINNRGEVVIPDGTVRLLPVAT